MDRTGHFTGYVSAPRRGPANQLYGRLSDSPMTAGAANPTRSLSRTSNRRSTASTPKEPVADPRFSQQAEVPPSPSDTVLIKVETPANDYLLLESSEAPQSRPSTAESARIASMSTLYPISPPSGYPSISQLLSSPRQPDTLPQQTPSTASSSSGPPTPWTPYQTMPSPFLISPAQLRQPAQPAPEAWSGVVLSPILVDDRHPTPRLPQPIQGLRPVEPPMQPSYSLPTELQPGFKSEGWLAGDYPRSGGSSSSKFMML